MQLQRVLTTACVAVVLCHTWLPAVLCAHAAMYMHTSTYSVSESATTSLHHSQCFELRLWPHQHPLQQFEGTTGLTWQVLEKLQERDLTLDRLQVRVDC